MSRSSLLGKGSFPMTGFYLTMTAVFASHTSRYSTYLSSLRVCEDLAIKGQSSRGPRVHSQGGEGKRLPLISQRTIVLIGILVWNIAIMYFRNPLPNFSKAKGWTAWGLGVLIMVFSSMVNLGSCHQLSTPLSQLENCIIISVLMRNCALVYMAWVTDEWEKDLKNTEKRLPLEQVAFTELDYLCFCNYIKATCFHYRIDRLCLEKHTFAFLSLEDAFW